MISTVAAVCVFTLSAHWPFAVSAPVRSDGVLTIEPQLVETKYCVGSPGPRDTVSLVSTLLLVYRNTGQVPILVPRVMRLAEYALFSKREEIEKNLYETRVLLGDQLPDLPNIAGSSPDPQFFATIAPGEALDARTMIVRIALHPPRRPGVALLGRNHYLRLLVDHWPASRIAGERLRERWRQHGLLWLEQVESLPVSIYIEKEPKAESCKFRVD